MDLLTPETLGGAGVTVGGIGLVVFVRLVFHLGRIQQEFAKFLKDVDATLDAQRKHYAREELHQDRTDDLLVRIEANTRAGVPRATSGEHASITDAQPGKALAR